MDQCGIGEAELHFQFLLKIYVSTASNCHYTYNNKVKKEKRIGDGCKSSSSIVELALV